jgi:hypothetical protein
MAKYPNWTVLKKVDATSLAAGIPDITTKVAATTITSNITLANDAELQNIALGVGTWEIEVMLWATGSSTGNLKTAWAFTGTLTGTPNRACTGPGASNTAVPTIITPVTMNVVAYNLATQNYGLNNSAPPALPYYVIKEESPSFVVSVAGNFAVQVAQNLSSASSTTIQPGSRVKVRQIA